MRRLKNAVHLHLLVAFCLGLGALNVPGAQTNSFSSHEELAQKLEQFVQLPRFQSSQWGIQIKSLDTGKVIFEHDAQKRLKPASNNKLYTGALALEELGPDYRIVTSIAAKKQPSRSGTLSGDLVIIGRGDPSFSARFHAGDYEAALRPLIEAIAATGIKRINGDIVADESFFRGPSFGNGWTWDDLQYYYGAEVSACTYQDNTVDLAIVAGKQVGDTAAIELKPFTPLLQFINRVQTSATNVRASITVTREPGSSLVTVSGHVPLGGKAVGEAVTVPRPALWFAQAVKDALIKRGIKVKGDIRRITAEDKAAGSSGKDELIELTSVSSPPMRELVKQMMKPSQNLYAQLLFLQVAARHADHAKDLSVTTEDIGLRRMAAFMQKVGVARNDVLIEEGSGLSRGALVTPRATVQLLEYMARTPNKDIYYDALPIAGKDGTLRMRMRGTLAEGNAHAKTGSLRYVNALSGYVTNRTGERFIFSFLSNAHVAPSNGPSARNDLDQIVVWLAESKFETKK
jgi:serine-type D-Ala-D-Ala carboxypeptidase/endopeptidase (penicillin-binding protein 4)